MTKGKSRKPRVSCGRRVWVTELVDHKGFILKINRAADFDRAIGRVVPSVKKYGATGASIFHVDSDASSARATVEVRRNVITVTSNKASSYHNFPRW